MLDRVLVSLVRHDESVENIASMIDEVNAIFSHRRVFLVDAINLAMVM